MKVVTDCYENSHVVMSTCVNEALCQFSDDIKQI